MVGFGRRERHAKGLLMHARQVRLYIDRRRFQCRNCGKTLHETLPDVTECHWLTARLARWIGQLSLKRLFLSISDATGINEQTVRNIFRDYISEPEAKVRLQTPRIMGIDETHLIKQRCVISIIGNKTDGQILLCSPYSRCARRSCSLRMTCMMNTCDASTR
ncbi:MAG: hypothetical protein Q4G62_06035 [Pseudomonadota bacterium]|nr:hypothetical protein [Pseudomonadota bacterium]